MQDNQYPLKRNSLFLLRCGYAAMSGKMVHFNKSSQEPTIENSELSSFPYLYQQETYWASRLIWC